MHSSTRLYYENIDYQTKFQRNFIEKRPKYRLQIGAGDKLADMRKSYRLSPDSR